MFNHSYFYKQKGRCKLCGGSEDSVGQMQYTTDCEDWNGLCNCKLAACHMYVTWPENTSLSTRKI